MTELTPREVLALAELDKDWQARGIRCQCEQHGKPCQGTAEYTVECHVLNNCKGPDCNERGNQVELLCVSCAQHSWLEAARRAAELTREAGGHAVPLCGSCLRPMNEPRHLMPSIKHTAGGIR